MRQLSLLQLAPQRVLNSILAALLLLTTPTLAHGTTAPPPRATVALADSAAAAQIAAQLPSTLTFHDRMGTAAFAHMAAPLSVEGAPITDYRVGDIGYVTAEHSIVIFLTDGTAVPDHGVTLLGHLTTGIDELTSCVRECMVSLALAP